MVSQVTILHMEESEIDLLYPWWNPITDDFLLILSTGYKFNFIKEIFKFLVL